MTGAVTTIRKFGKNGRVMTTTMHLPILPGKQKLYPLNRAQWAGYLRILRERAEKTDMCLTWHHMAHSLKQEKLAQFVETVLTAQYALTPEETAQSRDQLMMWLNEKKLNRSRDVLCANGAIATIRGLSFSNETRTFSLMVTHRA